MRTLFFVVFSSIVLLASSCVKEPERDIVGAWDAAIQDALADADVPATDHDTTPDGATDDHETEDDADTITGDELVVPDESSDEDFPCMWESCVTHEDCKRRECAATFCTTELGDLVPDNPDVCAVRCDPANNGAECPDGMTCNDQITLAAQFGKDIDGAKGICAPPMRQKFAFFP